MPSIPKTYEGTKYVSHTITKIELRNSPIKRWEIDVITEVPEGMKELRFSALFDLNADLPTHATEGAVNRFIEGMLRRWQKRTSADSSWISDLKDDLLKAIDEG